MNDLESLLRRVRMARRFTEVVEKVASEGYAVTFDYVAMDRVMRVLKDMGIAPSGYTAEDVCRMEMRVRLSDVERFRQRMEDAEARVEKVL